MDTTDVLLHWAYVAVMAISAIAILFYGPQPPGAYPSTST